MANKQLERLVEMWRSQQEFYSRFAGEIRAALKDQSLSPAVRESFETELGRAERGAKSAQEGLALYAQMKQDGSYATA